MAALLLQQPLAGNATPLTALLVAFRALHAPDGTTFVALCMICSALLGLIGAVMRLGWLRLALFMPQALILGFSAWGGFLATIHDHYLDGTAHYPAGPPFYGIEIPWQHISADQMGLFALFVVHSSAIIRRCWDPS